MDDSNEVTIRQNNQDVDDVESQFSDGDFIEVPEEQQSNDNESRALAEDNIQDNLVRVMERLENNMAGLRAELRNNVGELKKDMDNLRQEVGQPNQNQNRNDVLGWGEGRVNNRAEQNYRPQGSSPYIDSPGNRNMGRPNSKGVKMKPLPYNGKEDWEDYISQFEIVAELNNWTYYEKSLYLAGSLTGSAAAVLNGLGERQKRDFETVVAALNRKFGSVNKAEIFRSQVQTRVRGKDETIAVLAQSIKRMTRKGYPEMESKSTDVLALDYFIQALPDYEMRQHIRNMNPKDIDEAENLAVRFETHRLADKQRGRQVRKVGMEKNIKNEQDESDTVKSLIKQMKELSDWKEKEEASKRQDTGSYRNRPPPNRDFYQNNQYRRSPHQTNNNSGPGYNGARDSYQNSYQNKGDNPRPQIQGNGVGPSSRATTRQ